MQAIETMVFFSAAVIVGVIFLGFLTNWNYGAIFEGMKNLLMPGPASDAGAKLQKVQLPGFATFAYSCWKSCDFGNFAKDCGAVYVEASAEYSKLNSVSLLGMMKKLNFCDTDCGDFRVKETALPSVVTVKCEKSALVVGS